MKQTTLSSSFTLKGRALRSGKKIAMHCHPHDNGVVFKVKDTFIPALLEFIDHEEVGLTTTLKKDGVRVIMTEHLLSAIYGLGLDNILIELDQEEVPFCASSDIFTRIISKTGFLEIQKPVNLIRISERKKFYLNDKHIEVEPSPVSGITMSAVMDYDNALGTQVAGFTIDPLIYRKEISWSRTCLHYPLDEEGKLWEKKRKEFKLLPKNCSKSPYIIYTDKFLVEMKTDNEIARHKVLDMIGDFGLLGCRLEGKITGYRTGHMLNRHVASKIAESFSIVPL